MASPTAARGANLGALVVALCWLLVLFDGLDFFVFSSATPTMIGDKFIGPADPGTLGSYATFGMLIGALSAGTVTDWIGRRKVVLTSVTIFTLASIICATAPSMGVFAWGRFIAGLGLGGLLPTSIALVSDYAPRGRGNLFVGLVMTAHQAGGIVAALVGLWLIEPFGWRIGFWVGVLPILVLPVIAKFLPESLSFLVAKGRTEEARALAEQYGVTVPAAKPASGNRWDALADLFRGGRGPRTLAFWLASFGGLALVYGFSVWLPKLMTSEGYDLGNSTLFLLVVNLGGIFGMLVAGRISDRVGTVKVTALWFASSAAGLWAISIHMNLALTYLVMFVTGFFLFSAQTMVYAAVAVRYAPKSRATAVGWVSGMGRFGAVFGPWLGTYLTDHHHQDAAFTTFALIAVWSLVWISLTGFSRKEEYQAVDTPAVPVRTG